MYLNLTINPAEFDSEEIENLIKGKIDKKHFVKVGNSFTLGRKKVRVVKVDVDGFLLQYVRSKGVLRCGWNNVKLKV